jgi:hypothetical protein
MAASDRPSSESYPHGRGYGHDYMRGGEVLGGYGHSEREEFATPRGDLRTQTGTADGASRRTSP